MGNPSLGQFLYELAFPSCPLEHSLIQVVGITDSGAFIEAASNAIPFASPDRSVFLRAPSSPLYLTVATLIEKIASTGSLRLASTDVRVNPFHYFSSPLDVDRCVNGSGDILRSFHIVKLI